MAFRPNWYDDEPRGRRAWGGSIREWSGIRTVLTVTGAVFLLQYLLRSNPDALMSMDRIFALWAWVRDPEGGPHHFNLLFPLQLFSYMLLHADGWHIIGNMFYVWMFGQQVEAAIGKAAFLRLYVAGGVFAGLAQWAFNVVQQEPAPTVGASGAVYAIMVLYACRWPRNTVFLFPIPLPIPAMVIVGFRVFIDLQGFLMGTAGRVAVLAHLGGALFGYLWFRHGDVLGRVRQRYVREKAVREIRKTDDDRREMDRILGKIQATGLTSLNPDERAFLDRRSQELRRRGR